MSPGVIFDVDGTLLDNNYLHVIAWLRAFRNGGIEGVSAASIHRCVGMGTDHLVERLIGEPRPELGERHGLEYKPFRAEMRPFSGTPELIRTCAGHGLRVVLGTSANADNLGAMMEALGAADAIAEVVSSSQVPAAKPEPDIFLAGIERASLDPARTLVVGDTWWDIEAARRAGLGCIGVLTGGAWSRAELLEAGAVAVYRDPAELLAEFHASPLAALFGIGGGRVALQTER